MLKAKTYMPIADKIFLAKQIATQCLEERQISDDHLKGVGLLSLPCLRYENAVTKEILELSTLLSIYFDTEMSLKDVDSIKAYDYFMEKNIYNQLERYKAYKGSQTDTEIIRTNAFDILADFKIFKKFVDNEIYNLRQQENDSVARVIAAVSLYATPENVEKIQLELKEMIKEK